MLEVGDSGQHLGTNTADTKQLPRRLVHPADLPPATPNPQPRGLSWKKDADSSEEHPKSPLVLLVQEGRQFPTVVLIVLLVLKTSSDRLPQGTPILEIANSKRNPHRKIKRHQPVAFARAFLN